MEAVNRWALVALTAMVGGWLLVQITIWHYSSAVATNSLLSRVTNIERVLSAPPAVRPSPPAVRPSTPATN